MVFRPLRVDEEGLGRLVDGQSIEQHQHLDGHEHLHRGQHGREFVWWRLIERRVDLGRWLIGRFDVRRGLFWRFFGELSVRVLWALAVLSGCATSQVFVPAEQTATLQRRLVGEQRFLRLSFFATPFFGDSTKKLLTAVPPEHVRLLNNLDGSPMSPGPVERTFAPGTPVRITRIEFPTAYVMSERVLYTPRSLAWVYLDVASTSKQSPPFILVLRPGLKDENEVVSEIDRQLSRDDVRGQLEAFGDSVKAAILEKKAVVEMPADALEMAWGPPERKQLALDGTVRVETWTWADGKRLAVLRDGKVAEFK